MKSHEKKRLVRLVLVFVAVLGSAGVVRPWEMRRRNVGETPPVAFDDPTTTTLVADAPGSVELVKRFVRARTRPAAPLPGRDPFYWSEESAGGTTLTALWRAEDAAASRHATPPVPVVATAAVSPEIVEKLRRLRLFGTVGSPESGAAVVEGIGRVSVGTTVPGTPFLLRSIGPGVAVFAAGDVVIELSTPRPQGGTATSEKK
jgi:hypothetical protein